MKELVIGKSMNIIQKNSPDYSEEQLEIIEYGLTGLYLTITKTIVIFGIALALGILKEVIIFTLIYNIIRATSFGLHATKSWICLVCSSIVFLTIPFIATIIVLPVWSRILIGLICVLFIFKNSPADTEKRPIVNPKRRRIYKLLSTFIAVTFVILSVIWSDIFFQNCFIFTLIVQCFMISPFVYKIFKLPYDNYKIYQTT